MFFHFSKFNKEYFTGRAFVFALICMLVFGYSLLPSSYTKAQEEPSAAEVSENAADPTGGEGGAGSSDVQDNEEESVTIIETGDANAEGDAVNEVNTNNTNTEDIATEGTVSGSETVPVEPESQIDPPVDGEGSGVLTASSTADAVPPTDEGTGNTDTGGSGSSGNATTTINTLSTATSTPATDVMATENDEGNATSTPLTGSGQTDTGTSTPPNQTADADGTGQADIVDNDTGTSTVSELPNENASSTPEILNGNGDQDGTLDVEIENDAEVNNDVSVEANTGDNEANGNGGEVIIDTGNAYASADVINIVNSNFIGGEGFFGILNAFGALFGDVGLEFGSSTSCSFLGCFFSSFNVTNSNEAEVNNDVTVNASTGENSASGNENGSAIATGDAYASANVINFINTNIISDNFASLILNAFGSWTGDLSLPPPSEFEDGESCLDCAEDVKISNTNEANIENEVSVGADTGDNASESGEGVAGIYTGDAVADANVMTIANTNIFGGNALMVFVRTGGNWQGNIFNLPAGMEIVEVPGGFIIGGQGLLDSPISESQGIENLDVSNTNSADINNNVSVSADTGSNEASSSGGDSVIQTGNAYASANIVNVANTNFVGKNWLLAIVNIFGDWDGDVEFGAPDLWVGETAEAQGNPLMIGSAVKYTFTYRNNGNAPASNVRISDIIGEYFEVTDAGGGTVEGGIIRWDIGSIEPGEFGTVSYSIIVPDSPQIPHGEISVHNSVRIEEFEDDRNISDNSDSVSLNLHRPHPIYPSYQPHTNMNIVKERKTMGEIYAGDLVDYTVTLLNNSPGTIYDVMVYDTMYDPNGNIVSDQSWALGEVVPFEEIFLDYTIAIATTAPSGIYKNSAIADGYTAWNNQIWSSEGIDEMEVIGVHVSTSEPMAAEEIAPEEIIEIVTPIEKIELIETVEETENMALIEDPPIIAQVLQEKDGDLVEFETVAHVFSAEEINAASKNNNANFMASIAGAWGGTLPGFAVLFFLGITIYIARFLELGI